MVPLRDRGGPTRGWSGPLRSAARSTEYEGLRGDSLVMFGEEDDAVLLGVTTLEAFGFILDPICGELKPVPLRM